MGGSSSVAYQRVLCDFEPYYEEEEEQGGASISTDLRDRRLQCPPSPKSQPLFTVCVKDASCSGDGR